jgi:hypothetical protein
MVLAVTRNVLVVRQLLAADHAVQICLHELLRDGAKLVNTSAAMLENPPPRGTDLNEVHFGEALERSRLDNVEDRDDVFVVEPAEELDLSQGSQAEHCEVPSDQRPCPEIAGGSGERDKLEWSKGVILCAGTRRTTVSSASWDSAIKSRRKRCSP